MPKLQISSPGFERIYDLTEDTITIGRTAENVLQIEDSSVSSGHAELTKQDSDYFLRDLGSTNGTRVNGEVITQAILQNGDFVQFGQIEAVYQSEAAASAHRPLPSSKSAVAVPAASSHVPSDFANASPFSSKQKKKSPLELAIFGFAGLAVLVFLGSVIQILTLQP